jgi:putative nucleotidyltransferase with HDIG domain
MPRSPHRSRSTRFGRLTAQDLILSGQWPSFCEKNSKPGIGTFTTAYSLIQKYSSIRRYGITVLKPQKVALSDMMICLSRVMEWTRPAIVKHQMRVAYIVQNIAKELGLSLEHQNQLILAGMLHDIGAFSMKESIHLTDYDIDPELIKTHAELGYQLLKNFRHFQTVAELIRDHHVPWKYGINNSSNGPYHSQIIFLAGKVDSCISRDKEILGQVPDICAKIREDSGAIFVPEYVDAFSKIAKLEYFWFNIDSASVNESVIDGLQYANIDLDISDMIDLSKVFSHLIDFRCHFTATHSSGVAGTAEALANLYSFSESDCQMMKIAGYLHDIGKLTIPPEILHKPGKLTEEEFNIVKKHPFWTYRTLKNIKGLEEINTWASFHHERIDSCGYPFRYKGTELPLGSRIIAVADIFTALTESRPYRKGMHRDTVLDILREQVTQQGLDNGVVSMLINNYQCINESRMREQEGAAQLYREFYDATQVSNQGNRCATA